MPISRAVLIAIPERPSWLRDGEPTAGPGRPLPLRQLDFALACGCTAVLAVGDAGAPEAEALRREARAVGMPLHFAADARGLLGQLTATDDLLVLAARLLPESPEAVRTLADGPGVLVVPADPAVEEGFERIDGQRAWAGAALIPGGLIERLTELPRDSDPPAALLRIALQARVPERRLPDGVLEEGSWAIVAAGPASSAPGAAWQRRQLHGAPRHDLTGRLAQVLVRRSGTLRTDRRVIAAFLAGAGLLLAAAVAAAWWGWPAIGLVLLAPAALSAAVGALLARIGAGPFGLRKRRSRVDRDLVLPVAFDLALFACAALAMDGEWLGRLFPPLVLLIALHLRRTEDRHQALAVLSDRLLLVLLLAMATAVALAEPAIMLLALVFLLGDRLNRR